MIHLDFADLRPLPSISGLNREDNMVYFDPSAYDLFIRRVTGLTVDEGPTPREASRIANILEGFIDEKKREGNWSPELLEAYPTVESLIEVYALTRVLRVYGETVTSSRD